MGLRSTSAPISASRAQHVEGLLGGLAAGPGAGGGDQLGTKNQFFDKRLTLNLSAFRTELTGLQANIALPWIRSYLANVGDVRSQGVEAEGAFDISPNLTFSANGSYIDATHTSYANGPCPVGKTAPCDLSGERLYQSPKYIANASLRYAFNIPVWDADGYGLLSYAYRSNQEGSVQADPLTRIPSYSLVNAGIGAKFQDGKYDLSFWADNLLNETYFQSSGTASIVGASAYGISARLGTPRTYGATLRATF